MKNAMLLCVLGFLSVSVACNDDQVVSVSEEDIRGDETQSEDDVVADAPQLDADASSDTLDGSSDTNERPDLAPPDDTPVLPGCLNVEFTAQRWKPAHPAQGFFGEWLFFKTEAEFVALFGEPLPVAIDFGAQWLIAFEEFPYGEPLGTRRDLLSLNYCPNDGGGQGGLNILWDNLFIDCSTLSFQEASYQLLSFDIMTAKVPLFGGGGGGSKTYDCSVSGALEAEPCTIETLCQPGFLCAGLTRDEIGVCVSDSENWRTFENFDTASIPDGEPNGVESINQVVGLNGVDADVILGFSISHPSVTDLVISLVSPSGQVAMLSEHESIAANRFKASVSFPVPETVNGDWVLRIVDDTPGNAGELVRWSLELATR